MDVPPVFCARLTIRGRPDRLADTMRAILTKSLLIRGFILREFVSRRERFHVEASEWIAQGQLRYREDMSMVWKTRYKPLSGC